MVGAGPWTWWQTSLELLESWAWGVQSTEVGTQGLGLEDMRVWGEGMMGLCLGCCSSGPEPQIWETGRMRVQWGAGPRLKTG